MAAADEDGVYGLARVFFEAATKASPDSEDILPQEDGEDTRLSVFYIFAELFPEAVGEHGAGAKNKRMRLHFNKIGYSMYGKEQSRRVPSLRAKPGNPGYGFRRARWRDTLENNADRTRCETILAEAGCDEERIQTVLRRVQEVRHEWDKARRPSRPAGPGRPRRSEGESRVKGEKSRSPRYHEEPNSEPRNTSPGVHGTVMEPLTIPSGAYRESRDEQYDGRAEQFALLQAASRMHEAAATRGDGLQPSPMIKRARENEALFSPSIYPRLTALKLTSPHTGPAFSPGQLAGFRGYECQPLQNRSPRCSGAGGESEPDLSSLVLPPLTLSPCAQPTRGVYESGAVDSIRALKMTRRILGGGDKVGGEIGAAPARLEGDKPKDMQLRRGCQELSALEFLANAAAAQPLASI